jgi:hypothetical protein
MSTLRGGTDRRRTRVVPRGYSPEDGRFKGWMGVSGIFKEGTSQSRSRQCRTASDRELSRRHERTGHEVTPKSSREIIPHCHAVAATVALNVGNNREYRMGGVRHAHFGTCNHRRSRGRSQRTCICGKEEARCSGGGWFVRGMRGQSSCAGNAARAGRPHGICAGMHGAKASQSTDSELIGATPSPVADESRTWKQCGEPAEQWARWIVPVTASDALAACE